MLRAVAVAGRRKDLKVSFAQFFGEFLMYGDAPPKRPYVIPFSLSNSASIFGGSNYVAGSYAAGSLRAGKAFREVVSVSGERATTRYSLSETHVSGALEHLLFGKPVPVVPLSLFLYRDYGLTAADEVAPEQEIFVREFRTEFGLAALGDSAEVFDKLFEVDSSYLRSVPITQLLSARGAP
jgi:hypothetical protein